MTTDEPHNGRQPNGHADRLAREFGISIVEARDLISMLGSDWNSLVREARIIRAARDKR